MPLIEESMIEAAQTVMDALVEATGCTEGKNAFQYFLPPIHSAWMLSISGGGSSSELAQCTVSHMRMAANMEGRFISPTDAQRFIMQVMAILPVDDRGNVQRLHIIDTPTVEPEITVLANQENPGLFYKVRIGMEVVFVCS